MKPTIKLIILLLLCSIILVGYAILPEKPILYGDWGFRQLPLRRTLAEVVATDTIIADTVTVVKEETDTTKQRILLFGDSMVGTLCYRMSKYAEQNGHTLECVTVPSTTTHKWAEGDKLQTLLDDFQPTYVFVCLGSNELYNKDIERMETNIRKINSIIGDIPIIWIGPPNWCDDGGINKAMANVMGKRGFFSSKDLTLDRQPDGHHPNNAGGVKWADAIAKWIRDGKSVHPILFEVPGPDIKGKMKLIMEDAEHAVKKADSLATNHAMSPAEQTSDAPAPAQTEKPTDKATEKPVEKPVTNPAETE